MVTQRVEMCQQVWYQQDTTTVLDALSVDRRHGLSTEEAHERLEQYGYNELEERVFMSTEFEPTYA